MTADHEVLRLMLSRDLAERRAIDEQRRGGDWHNVTNGRLLFLNDRIGRLIAAGVVPLF